MPNFLEKLGELVEPHVRREELLVRLSGCVAHFRPLFVIRLENVAQTRDASFRPAQTEAAPIRTRWWNPFVGDDNGYTTDR